MRIRSGDGWLPLSLAGAAGVTIADAALMERRFGVFRGGFLAPDHLETFAQRVGFLVISGVSDLVVIGLLAGLTLWLAGRWGLATVPRRFLAVVVGVGPLLLADLFSYQLLAYLGDAFDLSLMWDLVGGQPREFLAVSAGHLTEPLWLLLLASAALGAIVWLLQRRFSADGGRGVRRGPAVVALVLVAIVGSAAVTGARTLSEPMQQGLRRKPSAHAIAVVVNLLTDIDRDGYGVGHRPPDANQFDASVYPYAVDLPGNGIDENGVGGDLPLGGPAYVGIAAQPPVWAWRPDVVIVLLESVRADALDAVIDGKPATPTMRAIAAAGGSAPLAFSHNGFTYQSRYHLFSGTIAGTPGSTTLIDDFKANGYRVGYFSGQDDSFGGPELAVGFERADTFFDARSAPDRRYTRFTTPGSLAVPAGVVLEQVSTFLSTTDRAQPMFLYVNFHDTHFPYHHDGIEPIVSSTVLEQSRIAPAQAVQLREMYMNTVANVDRAIGALLSEMTRVRGRAPAILVTSDHGESLFDEGFLGHGYALNDAQTRVPFVSARLPLVLPQPFAQADVRQAIRAALVQAPAGEPRPDFTSQATTPSFQYLGSISQPRMIGLRDGAGRILYDFREDRVLLPGGRWERPAALTPQGTTAFLDMVRRWERMLTARPSDVHSRAR